MPSRIGAAGRTAAAAPAESQRPAAAPDRRPALERPARVLFVMTSPVRGGVEEVVLALLTHLDRREFEVGLACPQGLIDSLRGELSELEVQTFAAGADSWLRRREVSSLADAIRRFSPDLVNPHLFRSTMVAAPLAKWLGVPRVVETYHGREAWRRGLVGKSFLVDRAVCRYVDRFIAVSRAAADFLIRRKKVPPAKVAVVPNGRDLARFAPGTARESVRRELGIGAEALLGIVGRLEPQKGHEYALRAFARLLRQAGEARLLLVGDGSRKEALRSLASELGIADKVLFAGFRSDVPRLLDAIDVVLLPSLYEGMPLTVIEAAAMAKPVVATSVDGTPEVLADGVTGRLVPPADPAALAEAVLGLLRDRELARRMGRAARQSVLERFSVVSQASATGRVFRETLAPRREQS